MKTFPKILTIFFLTVFILQIICLFFLLTAPVASKAADIKFTPQVEIPGMSDSEEFGKAEGGGYTIPDSTAAIAKYIRVIYKYAIGVVGILAAVVLMLGGVLWLTAGGNTSRVTEAKAWITASLTGLVLALSSYLILATVNPALVNFKITKITSVEEIGCCENTASTCSMVSKSLCNESKWHSGGQICYFDGKCALSPPIEKNCCDCTGTLRSSSCFDNSNSDITTQTSCEKKCKDLYTLSYKATFTLNAKCNLSGKCISFEEIKDNSIKNDAISCGEPGIQQEGKMVCGTKCSAGFSCQKTNNKNIHGIKKCPHTPDSPMYPANYWLCGSTNGVESTGGIQEGKYCKRDENLCAQGLKCVVSGTMKYCRKIGSSCGSNGFCIESLGGLSNCGSKDRIWIDSCPAGLYCCK